MDMVSAYCTVNKGDLPLDIYWTRNGGRVFTNDGLVVTRNSQRINVLSIESVRARHAGLLGVERCVYASVGGESGGAVPYLFVMRVCEVLGTCFMGALSSGSCPGFI